MSSEPARPATRLDAGRRNRGPGCVSSLTLDRFGLGELDGSERQQVFDHLAGCADCTRANQALIADRALFESEAAIANLAADAMMRAANRRQSWPWRRLLAPFALVATCAVGFAFFAAPRSGMQSKGDFSLSAYVLHPESATAGRMHLGEPLHPGDKLQFRYNGAEGGYLTVVAVDAGGKVSVYYPPDARAAAVPAGRDVPLSSAVELDETLGQEVIVGVRCAAVVAVSDVIEATRKAVAAARARGVAATEVGSLGLPCVETRYQIAKQPPPAP